MSASVNADDKLSLFVEEANKVEEEDDVGAEEAEEEFEEDEDDEEEDEDEENEPMAVCPRCDFCGQQPCDWEMFGDQIAEECDEMVEKIRFHGYKLYTRLKHGVLRRYDRRELPVCVRGEIMDSYPDPNHKYVGFQLALQDVEED
jgi:hypothetical protein